jgi:hypothetical protein
MRGARGILWGSPTINLGQRGITLFLRCFMPPEWDPVRCKPGFYP